MRRFAFACCLLGFLGATRARAINVTPGNWAKVLGDLSNPSADRDLVFAKGIYVLEHTLQISAGGGRVALRAGPGETPLLIGQTPDLALIRIDGAASVRIEGLHIRRGSVAVSLRNAADVTIADNWFDDVDIAVVGVALSGARLVHNRIDQTGGTPILLQGGAGAQVSQNVIHDYLRSAASGAAVALDTERAPTVSNNLIENQFGAGAAIWARRCSGATITGNVVLDAYPADWREEEGRGAVVKGNHWPQGTPAGNFLVTFPEQVPEVLAAAGLDRAHRALIRAAPDLTVPGPCLGVTAAAGDRCALVTWHPPRFDGGAPVLAYRIEASTGSSLTISDGHFRSEGFARLDQIPNGKPCAFTITAINKIGRGKASIPSAAVTPVLIRPVKPAAPRLLRVSRDGGMACVTFAAPPSDGGALITSYVLTILPAKNRVVFSGRQILRLRARDTCFGTIDELAQKGDYGFTLAAVNSAGEGPAAALSP